MASVREERIKLFATYLNTIGAGSFVAGFIAPMIALATAQRGSLFPTAVIALIFLASSICLHMAAQKALGRLGL